MRELGKSRSRRHALCGTPSRREGPRCLKALTGQAAPRRPWVGRAPPARAQGVWVGRTHERVVSSHSHLGGQRREHIHKRTTKNMYVRTCVRTNKHRRPRGPRGPRREGPKWMVLMPSWKVHQRPCARRCCSREPMMSTPRTFRYSAARSWWTCSARSTAVRRTPRETTMAVASGRIRAVHGRVHTMTYVRR